MYLHPEKLLRIIVVIFFESRIIAKVAKLVIAKQVLLESTLGIFL